jgi:hypothetical protein
MFAKKFFPKYENTLSSASYYYTGWSKTDTGRISKDIYPILISPNRQKRIFPITFWRWIFWGYNILILGVIQSLYHNVCKTV